MEATEEIKKERSKVLSQLSEFLSPSKEYTKTGNLLGQQIIQICQAMKNYKISRPTVGGSIGKKTALPDKFKPDFDIILPLNEYFNMDIDTVNDKKPEASTVKKQYEKVLKDIKVIVQDKLSKVPGVKNVQVTSSKICLKLLVEKDDWQFAFDVLPTHNFHPNPNQHEKSAPVHLKRAIKTVTIIYNDPECVQKKDLLCFYSSCFSEAALEFLQKQSPMTNQNVRIAKLWLSKLVLPKPAFGLTFLVELLAIWSTKSEENKKSKQVFGYDAFKQFLKNIKNFDMIAIVFTENYEKDDVPVDILEQRPLVLDPANPTNNIASIIGHGCQNMLKTHADETLKLIEGGSLEKFAESVPQLLLEMLCINSDE